MRVSQRVRLEHVGDDVRRAIIPQEMPLLGTQFHPELYDETHQDGRKILQNFSSLQLVGPTYHFPKWQVDADREAIPAERIGLVDTWAEKGTDPILVDEGSIGVWS